ncbi:hypothetical protein J1777_06130 [Comamonas denitrificans]|uniref:Uncharacterized protein n=1 Tax=Comamonas denitrificans TaxID=117506 RepID=A0A939H005_9BURK|nr:hypothetical protein [Comamonas denitrificans]MBO1249415.1 hypothetical protein [Comamonas denitrificans]
MLESALALIALILALLLRPWRQLLNRRPLVTQSSGDASGLWTPLLATLVVLPWMWALPTLHQMPLQLQWSGACLVLLMLGWPLAVLTLLAVGVITWLLSPSLSVPATLALTVWHGLVPATLAMGWGALLRRFLGTKVFVYLFGRGFFGTVVCLFIAGLLAQAAGEQLPGVQQELGKIARWLMAWGDAVVTGMLTAVFVAYRPQWLATWSDDLYLYQQQKKK